MYGSYGLTNKVTMKHN